MVKTKNVITLCSVALVLSACSLSGKAQNKEYKKTIDISIDYGNIRKDKVTPIFSEDINLDGVKLLDKGTKTEFNANYVCGEQLEVFYKDKNMTEIDYVVVNSEGLVCIKMTNLPLPGSGEMDIFEVKHENNENKPIVLTNFIDCVINTDDSFTMKSELEMSSELWGVYRIEDIYKTNAVDGSELEAVRLLACYSFNPALLKQ